jgi:hypothetical protein
MGLQIGNNNRLNNYPLIVTAFPHSQDPLHPRKIGVSSLNSCFDAMSIPAHLYPHTSADEVIYILVTQSMSYGPAESII